MGKIITKNQFLKLEKKFKNKNIILCHGVFDLLHVGHIKYLEEAKKRGDILIVSVTDDKFVNKGIGRPFFKIAQRTEALASLSCVDFVIISSYPTAINNIQLIKPKLYIKGSDYKDKRNDITGEIVKEKKQVEKYGGKIFFTNTPMFSSSKLINANFEILNEKQKKDIISIKKYWDINKITKVIDEIKNIKILIIGEMIIDEYVFCDALGKSGKEPVLALRSLNSKKYIGGSGVIANHISSFCKRIDLKTCIGEKKEFFNFINKNLKQNVNVSYIFKKNSPTIYKKRYLDMYNNTKILGIYDINDSNLDKINEKKFREFILKKVPKYDLVIVSDYGHGLISKKNADLICEKAKFLALNTQVNASNIGYHTLSKYKKVDFSVINEIELRHEMKDKFTDTKELIKQLNSKSKIKNLMVTQGKQGSILFNRNKKTFYDCAAYAQKVVDKVGAGDSMVAISAALIYKKIHPKLVLLIASLAASQKVENMGNSKTINKINILKSIEHLLK